MTREQLAQQKASRVRNNARLATIYKKYIQEDAKYIYPNGRLPSNCFSCSFATHFDKWARYIKNKKIMTTKKNNNTVTYELVNNNSRVYFQGKVLSNKSDDSEWIAFIRHNKEREEKRLAMFKVLPKDLRSDEKTQEVEDPKTDEETEDVEVTEQLLKDYPELVEAGVKVGEIIQVEKPIDVKVEKDIKTEKAPAKKQTARKTTRKTTTRKSKK